MNEATNVQSDGADSHDLTTDRILARIGALTKTLRESMRELGLDKHVELAAEAVPDARDRLKYVANMTEQAAERVLTAIDIAKPLQEQLQADAAALDGRWERWFAAPIERDEVRVLMGDTRDVSRTGARCDGSDESETA